MNFLGNSSANWDKEALDNAITEIEGISDGGAALTAYGKLQFEKVNIQEREAIEAGLIKYCELYTQAVVNQHYYGKTTTFPLVAKRGLNKVLMYEIEDKLKMGLETYYFSPQKLKDGVKSREYWLFGFMVEKIWKNFSIFLNFENLGNTRQTKFELIYIGSITNPIFKDIYAPVDGFIINGGLKIKLKICKLIAKNTN